MQLLKNRNTIYIIGAGAVGKSLAVFLKLAKREVILIRGSVDHESSRTEIIKVVSPHETVLEANVEIKTLSSFSTLNGIIVLTNKSFGNAYLAATLKSKVGSSPIVLLQNGLGIEKPFITNGFLDVYRCVLFLTSQSIDQTTTRFKSIAISPIGIEKGSDKTLAHIIELLNTPHLEFKSEVNIQQIIWKKVIVNSVFNSICPLLNVDNGLFHRNERAFAIAQNVISECIVIAREKGIMINQKEVEESLLKISTSSDGQLISTLQDIINHRQTEIDTFNFEIVRIAESLNKVNQVQNTKLLGELTKIRAEIQFKKN